MLKSSHYQNNKVFFKTSQESLRNTHTQYQQKRISLSLCVFFFSTHESTDKKKKNHQRQWEREAYIALTVL